MTIVDEHGRLFGRINLVDGAVAGVVLLLIPLAYGTYLLFRPATPRIDSVAPSAISREEDRIAAGARLMAKFKITGTGFTPLLRARIGEVEALGFVFENPNSADILVGPVPPGPHDLVLMDGVHEVARVAGAISVEPEPKQAAFVRAVGWFTNLDAEAAAALRVGLAFPESAPAFEVLAIGPAQPVRSRVRLDGSSTDRGEGRVEREAVLTLRCESAGDNPCALGDRPEDLRSFVVSLAGPSRSFLFALQELLPPAAPRAATIRVRLPAETAATLVRIGDRDDFLDERAAVVTASSRTQAGVTVTLELGLDEFREGWRYRTDTVKAGAPFRFSTDRYEASGTIESVTLSETPAARTP